jgi:hypothetical protein
MLIPLTDTYLQLARHDSEYLGLLELLTIAVQYGSEMGDWQPYSAVMHELEKFRGYTIGSA